MAQFYATINSGRRATTTKTGHKTTGLDATVNGWNKGVRVLARYNEEKQRDEFFIYQTSGSNGQTADKLIKHIK